MKIVMFQKIQFFYMYNYKKPPYHIKCMDFYNYITKEKKIDI